MNFFEKQKELKQKASPVFEGKCTKDKSAYIKFCVNNMDRVCDLLKKAHFELQICNTGGPCHLKEIEEIQTALDEMAK